MDGRIDDPPPYFGDYPDGVYWSAVRPDNYVEPEEDFSVEGTNLELMWDQVGGPLWADEGLLPDDPEWLRRALGLSESLIADVLEWMRDMEALDRYESRTPLDNRGQQLAERLQAEVGTRFHVTFRT